jgi:uncharacterized protein (UPF0335 family)
VPIQEFLERVEKLDLEKPFSCDDFKAIRNKLYAEAISLIKMIIRLPKLQLK